MRRLLYLVLVALVAGFSLAQDEGGTTIERRVFEIAGKLRCPICVSESVAASSSQIAITMRQEIQEQLESGLSESQILAGFQASYGDWVLLEPPRRGVHLLVWLLPVVAGAAGLVLLIGFMKRWTRAAADVPAASEADLERVREALDRDVDPE